MTCICTMYQVSKCRYQYFTISLPQGDGDAQELLSDRDGPVRLATILKTPYPGVDDEFAEQRPIIGVVTKKGV